MEGFNIGPGRKHEPSELWVSRLVRVYIYVVLSYLVCGSSYTNPRKQIIVRFKHDTLYEKYLWIILSIYMCMHIQLCVDA